MHFDDWAIVYLSAANILTLSHYFDKVLISLSEPDKNCVRHFLKSSYNMNLFLHLKFT